MSTTSPSISLHVQITIDSKNVQAFFDTLEPAYQKAVAEPECTFFEVFQSLEDPGTISWVENWSASVDWFMNVQIKKDYYKEYFEITEPMFLKPRRVELNKRVGGLFCTQKEENWKV